METWGDTCLQGKRLWGFSKAATSRKLPRGGEPLLNRACWASPWRRGWQGESPVSVLCLVGSVEPPNELRLNGVLLQNRPTGEAFAILLQRDLGSH